LCFDGASKGNPREAGVGGVILDPRGNIEMSFAWSLGCTTNNQAEEYTLLKGVQLVRENQIQRIIIIGDSLNSMIKGTLPKDSQLYNIIKKTRNLLVGIPQVSFSSYVMY
jgi:ribonuclease HI